MEPRVLQVVSGVNAVGPVLLRPHPPNWVPELARAADHVERPRLGEFQRLDRAGSVDLLSLLMLVSPGASWVLDVAAGDAQRVHDETPGEASRAGALLTMASPTS